MKQGQRTIPDTIDLPRLNEQFKTREPDCKQVCVSLKLAVCFCLILMDEKNHSYH